MDQPLKTAKGKAKIGLPQGYWSNNIWTKSRDENGMRVWGFGNSGLEAKYRSLPTNMEANVKLLTM